MLARNRYKMHRIEVQSGTKSGTKSGIVYGRYLRVRNYSPSGLSNRHVKIFEATRRLNAPDFRARSRFVTCPILWSGHDFDLYFDTGMSRQKVAADSEVQLLNPSNPTSALAPRKLTRNPNL